MKKLIAEAWISLDGYAADVNGATDFFPSTEKNRASDEDQLKFMENIDTILLGRKTYEIFADFWPKVSTDQEIVSDRINSIPKVVISNTIKHAPWGKWSAASVLAGDAMDEIKKLKQQDGKDIVLWGSISLAQALMQADMVDEYRIHVCPVRLGAGRPLFPNIDQGMQQLRITDTKVYHATGVVFLKYTPNR